MVDKKRASVFETVERITQDAYEKRLVKAMVGNLDFYGALERYLNINVSATDEKQKSEEKDKKKEPKVLKLKEKVTLTDKAKGKTKKKLIIED